MQTLKIATACLMNPQRELLVVRKQNTTKWMLPGGKLEAGETPEKALIRELQEELQIDVCESDLQSLGMFEAIAANEANTRVCAQVYLLQLPKNQTLQSAAEIAQMQWLPIEHPIPSHVAPLLREFIIPALLKREGLV